MARRWGRASEGVIHPLSTAPFGVEGIGTVDKAWITLPAAVPGPDEDREQQSHRYGVWRSHSKVNMARFKGDSTRSGFEPNIALSCAAGGVCQASGRCEFGAVDRPWKGGGPLRRGPSAEVAAPRTWLLSKG